MSAPADDAASGSVRHPEFLCPFCGSVWDATTELTGQRMPADGDFGLCFSCAEPSVFVVGSFGITLRRPTPEESAWFAVDHGDKAEILGRFNASRRQAGRS